MKLALLADIHGNSQALESVLKAASEEGVDELLIMGDLVGYYFHPDEVLELLEPWKKVIIRGNHEESLAQAITSVSFLEGYEKRYGSGLRIALERLNREQINMLTSLPDKRVFRRGSLNILMCHGSPWDVNHYIYPDAKDEVFERCFESDIDMVLSGHTHYAHSKEINGARFINPGSVGQPRDRSPGAAWALLDTSNGSVTFKREKYDISSVVIEARNRHPELPYLSEVLLRE